jgi:hypothetical protein
MNSSVKGWWMLLLLGCLLLLARSAFQTRTGIVGHDLTEVLQAWSDCVSFGAFEAYRDRFEKIQQYFAPRFPEAVRVGNEMIRTILERTANSAT